MNVFRSSAALFAVAAVLAAGSVADCAVAQDDFENDIRVLAEVEAAMMTAAEEAAARVAAEIPERNTLERLRVYRATYWNTLRDLQIHRRENSIPEGAVPLVDPAELAGPRWTEELLISDDPLFSDPRYVMHLEQALSNPRSTAPADVADFDGRFGDCVCVIGHGRGNNICSGVLLAPNVVLTAGHCGREFFPAEVRVGFNQAEPDEIAKVIFIARHPLYSDEVPRHDLMVLIVDPPIESIEPKDPVSPGDLASGSAALVVGYGESPAGFLPTGIRRVADDLVVVSEDCDTTDDQGNTDEERYRCTAHQEFVAADRYGRSPGADACRGDSGGPLYIRSAGEWKIAGIVSRSSFVDGRPPQRRCGEGGIYVRIDHFWDWITNVPGAQWPEAD